MCLIVFVGSDKPMPVIPFGPVALPFYARPLDVKEESVRRFFSKPFVYSVGASSGCGCGFYYNLQDMEWPTDVEVPDDVKKDAWADYGRRRESVRHLAEYLNDALVSGSAEVYSCWYGEWDAPLTSTRTVPLAHFGGEQFRFVERQLLNVVGRSG